jgi:hypothetical protein
VASIGLSPLKGGCPIDININWLAVLLAAVASFIVGGLWYSVLFAKVWQREAGLTDDQLKRGTAQVFVGSFLLTVVMAVVLAAFIGSGGAVFGALAGLAAGAACDQRQLQHCDVLGHGRDYRGPAVGGPGSNRPAAGGAGTAGPLSAPRG